MMNIGTDMAFYLVLKYHTNHPTMVANDKKHLAVSQQRKVVVLEGAVKDLFLEVTHTHTHTHTYTQAQYAVTVSGVMCVYTSSGTLKCIHFCSDTVLSLRYYAAT